jgi:hypothetical protein
MASRRGMPAFNEGQSGNPAGAAAWSQNQATLLKQALANR